MRPIKAIASAGGFLNTASRKAVRLLRANENAAFDQWILDTQPSLNGAGGNGLQTMLPGDILFVPKTGVAVANQLIDQYIRKMVPLDIGFGIGYILNDPIRVESSAE